MIDEAKNSLVFIEAIVNDFLKTLPETARIALAEKAQVNFLAVMKVLDNGNK